MKLISIPQHVHSAPRFRKSRLNVRYFKTLAQTYSVKLKALSGRVSAWGVILGGEYDEELFDKHGLDSELSTFDERKYHRLNLGKPTAA